ncbi:MAG: hypothetical protein KC620_13435, partial [Myxococcales bacterium]|nr:hypothetical protein [Myxococcales bacterium]
GDMAEGRVRTASALQYPGDPHLQMAFGARTRLDGHSIRRLAQLSARVAIGGRLPGAETCPAGLAVDSVPWLVPGFDEGTSEGPRAGERVRVACLDANTPGGPDDEARNQSLSRANPLPDGQGIERQIELIDGALIDEQLIFAIIRESIVTPLPLAGGQPLSAYGYVFLHRDPEEDDLAVGNAAVDLPTVEHVPLACDPSVLSQFVGDVAGPGGAISPAAANRLAIALVEGRVPVDVGALTPLSPAVEEPHVLCLATDDFDGGPDGTACPASSPVVFFTLKPGVVRDLPNEACHGAVAACSAPEDCPYCVFSDVCDACDDGQACLFRTCRSRLQTWADDENMGVRLYPRTAFNARDGEVVVPGVEGRCAAADGDLARCHAFFAEPGPEPINDFSDLRVGYLCHATGYLRDPSAAPSNPAQRPSDVNEDEQYCPVGSEVTYFSWEPPEGGFGLGALECMNDRGICHDGEPCSRYVCANNNHIDDDLSAGDIADGATDCQRLCDVGQPCDRKGACLEWLERDAPELRFLDTGVQWRCVDHLRGTCSDDRYDLTAGKRFFRADPDAIDEVRAPPIDDAIEAAFRYETRFRDRAGTGLGFTPALCDATSTAQSYCYDADEVRRVEQRVDCAVALYTEHFDLLDQTSRQVLQAFLERNFSLREERLPGLATPITHDGFERARTKLLVMLGDEAFTQALSSRFDRAGIRQAIFHGSEFEDGGIELQGVAGFEMHSLHLAVQYFDLALERFFHLGDAIHASLFDLPDGAGFITQGTAIAWFERLLRASMRKAAAQAEIAERYRVMAAPALGRRVVERASAAIHLESVLFSRVMQDLIDVSQAAAAPQIRRALKQAQTGWDAAQRQLASTYALLDDTPRFLGIPEGFVPFPPLDPDTLDVNAFEKLLQSARRKVDIAADKETQAIEDSRAFDTSAAEFRSALAALRADYEGRIGEICGTFIGDDGVVYAATPQNAHHDPRASRLGDPCGRMGNGAIAVGLATSELQRLQFEEAKQQQLNLYGTMDGLNATMQAQCERIVDLADFTWEARRKTISLRETIATLDIAIDTTDRTVAIFEQAASAAKCDPPIAGASNSPGNCVQVASSSLLTTAKRAAALALVVTTKTTQLAFDISAEAVEQSLEKHVIRDECRALQIDTHSQITGLFAEIPILANRVQQQAVQIERALAEVESLYHRGQALQAQYAEAEDLAIDVEAARNDPNVRIYRSDAVLAADRTFTAALAEVYEATLVFEYYTGQSYAERERLRYLRLARYGEDNLERYLAELADAFDDFEQVYGNPDLRVTIVSLRDVLAPSLIDGSGVPLSDQTRTDAFRAALAEAGRTDPRGRHRVDFRMAFDRVSPLTFGHKVNAIEAELVGEGLGDALARVYLTPTGTATVRGFDEDRQLRLPPRTAVLDTFFNGDRDGRLDPAIYRSERLRDQPLINTEWQVVFDDQAERVNFDVPIDALDDIRFYIYYTDFTEAP